MEKTVCDSKSASSRTLRGLDWLNFSLANVQAGVGPFLAIYLASHQWNEERVGLALSIGGIAGIVAPTPTGWLVDRLHWKRALVGLGVGALAVGALVTALAPTFGPVVLAQLLIGVACSLFVPAVCAISLGIVGHELFDARQGRNQTFNSAGNVTAAICVGIIGYFISNRSIFFFVVAVAIPTLYTLTCIASDEIDHTLARGATDEQSACKAASLRDLFEDRPLVLFLLCAAMFHFANAAMLPLLGEMLAKGRGRSSMLVMSACVALTQVVIAVVASWSGRSASSMGRKPLLLIAFGVLAIRGVLCVLPMDTFLLIAIQVLDGIGAAIFGVVSVLVVADLTRATGRFNLTLGATTTAVGIGASLSQVIAGAIVQRAGMRAGFIALAVAALAAFALLCFMPETRDKRPIAS